MQDQLKERLTGAAILVVVVVLAVPEMFRGHPGAVAPSNPPDASAIPLRTYTLVAGDPPAGAQSPAVAASQPAAPSRDMPPATGTTVAPGTAVVPAPLAAEAPPAAGPAGVPAQVVPAPAATQAGAPSVPPPAALQQAAPPAARVAATAKSAAARPARALDRVPAATGGWAVQVGSFRARELAERMVRDVHAKGFKVHVVGPDDRGLYRVRSALQPDKETALALKQQMVAHGLKPIVNASP